MQLVAALRSAGGRTVKRHPQRSGGTRRAARREELRLLPGGEVAAPVGLVEVGEAGVDRLDPAARGREDLAGEVREADRNRDRRRRLAGRGRCAWARPLSQYDRAAEAPVPVSQYSVMLSRMLSRVRLPVGLPSTNARGDLVVAVRVVVEHPGRQRDGRVQQRVADRLRPCGLLQEVAEAVRQERGERVVRRASPARTAPAVGALRSDRAMSRLMWMPSSPSGAWRPIASVTSAPTSPPWAT